jgi:hypothetical protein
VCNSKRLSKEIREWKAFFNHLYQGFETDFFQHIVLPGNAINSRVVGPVIELLEDVIKKEDNRQILQTDLRRMESLLQDITTLFQDQLDITALFQSQKKSGPGDREDLVYLVSVAAKFSYRSKRPIRSRSQETLRRNKRMERIF